MADFAGWWTRFKQNWISVRQGFSAFFSSLSFFPKSSYKTPEAAKVEPIACPSETVTAHSQANTFLTSQSQAERMVSILNNPRFSVPERLDFLAQLEQDAEDKTQPFAFRAARLKALSYFYRQGNIQDLFVFPNTEKASYYHAQVYDWWQAQQCQLTAYLSTLVEDVLKGRDSFGLMTLQWASDLGHREAQRLLGEYWRLRFESPKVVAYLFWQAAEPRVESAAHFESPGSVRAQWQLACWYAEGRNQALPRHEDTAAHYAYQAARQHHAQAQMWLQQQAHQASDAVYLLLYGLWLLEQQEAFDTRQAEAARYLEQADDSHSKAYAEALTVLQQKNEGWVYQAEALLQQALQHKTFTPWNVYRQTLKDRLYLRLGRYHEGQAWVHAKAVRVANTMDVFPDRSKLETAVYFYTQTNPSTPEGEDAYIQAAHVQQFNLHQPKQATQTLQKLTSPFPSLETLKARWTQWSSGLARPEPLGSAKNASEATFMALEQEAKTKRKTFKPSYTLEPNEVNPEHHLIYHHTFMEERYMMKNTLSEQEIPMESRAGHQTKAASEASETKPTDTAKTPLDALRQLPVTLDALQAFSKQYNLHAPSSFEQHIMTCLKNFEKNLKENQSDKDSWWRQALYLRRKDDVQRLKQALAQTKRTYDTLEIYNDEGLWIVCEELAQEQYKNNEFFFPTLYLNNLRDDIHKAITENKNNRRPAHKDLKVLGELEQRLITATEQKLNNNTKVAEEEKRKVEEEKRQVGEEKKRAEEEKRKVEEEKRRAEEEKRKVEEEKRKAEEEKKQADEEIRRIENEKRQAEFDRVAQELKAEREKRVLQEKLEQEKLQAELARQKAEFDKQLLEAKMQQTEDAKGKLEEKLEVLNARLKNLESEKAHKETKKPNSASAPLDVESIVAKAVKTAVEKNTKEFQAKIEDMEKKHNKRLEDMEKKHQAEIAQLKATIEKLKEEKLEVEARLTQDIDRLKLKEVELGNKIFSLETENQQLKEKISALKKSTTKSVQAPSQPAEQKHESPAPQHIVQPVNESVKKTVETESNKQVHFVQEKGTAEDALSYSELRALDEKLNEICDLTVSPLPTDSLMDENWEKLTKAKPGQLVPYPISENSQTIFAPQSPKSENTGPIKKLLGLGQK